MVSDGELNVLEDLLTEAPDQDDELYNPETERDVSDKKGTDTTDNNTTDTTETPITEDQRKPGLDDFYRHSGSISWKQFQFADHIPYQDLVYEDCL